MTIDSSGNPVGGLVFGNTFGANLQYHEWASFIGDSEFCMRACTGRFLANTILYHRQGLISHVPGPNARENCQHIYDG